MLVGKSMQTKGEMPIGIAGAGRVGQALGRLLRERGEPVAAIAGRDPQRTEAAAAFVGGEAKPLQYTELPAHVGRVLVTVPDDAVTSVAGILAGAGMRSGIALHTCGALGPDALAPLQAQGVSCGALHPMQTIATPEKGLTALTGATAFGITASGAAADWAAEIVRLLGGEALYIRPEQRTLYHAAAVMASNYLVGLIDAAAVLMEQAGIEREQALRALAPMIRASTENALALGPLGALTGPIERRDLGTVATHLRALSQVPESIEKLYRQVGLHVLGMSQKRAPKQHFAKMELLLREGKHP
jgi:predicted short-subunit dehydrogenase-like oxidoreductase (DUF2520 family)